MDKRPPLVPKPLKHVALENGFFVATSNEPWLAYGAPEKALQGRVVELGYQSGPFDEVVRPIVRFMLADGSAIDEIMPAPSAGRGLWRGRIPNGTTELRISPTNRIGPFSFDLRFVRPIPAVTNLRFRAASAKRSFFASSARMVGLKKEADLNLRWVFGRAETQDYAIWRNARTVERPFERRSRDKPIVIWLCAAGGDLALVRQTYASLLVQSHTGWTCHILRASTEVAAWCAGIGDPGLQIGQSGPVHDALLVYLRAGDEIAPEGLAYFAAHFERHPALTFVYSDECVRNPDGKARAVFKPDWSPLRQASAPYVGRAVMIKSCAIKDAAAFLSAAPEDAIDALLAEAPTQTVGHLRRVALATPATKVAVAARPRVVVSARCDRTVGIVIPTRDRVDLLEPCLASVLKGSADPGLHVVVVDNGSVEARTHETLARVCAADRRLTVAAMPGPFNFSALVNFGAAQVRGDVLIFLNNDTVVQQDDWIDNLVATASRPDVGAVGARLLYPNGAVQHEGVVLGLGGVAGHFGEGRPAQAPGWLRHGPAVFETSAVTGACLAVERAKFDAVGGFDAVNLPVELNDIDLCLKLGERGWRTICDCRTALVHYQSASRGGGALRLQSKYEMERSYFIAKWRHVIRDDPYFNPSLSIFDYEPRLG